MCDTPPVSASPVAPLKPHGGYRRIRTDAESPALNSHVVKSFTWFKMFRDEKIDRIPTYPKLRNPEPQNRQAPTFHLPLNPEAQTPKPQVLNRKLQTPRVLLTQNPEPQTPNPKIPTFPKLAQPPNPNFPTGWRFQPDYSRARMLFSPWHENALWVLGLGIHLTSSYDCLCPD